VEHLSRSLGIDLDTPWGKLSKKEQQIILQGNEGMNRSRIVWEGVVNQLHRRFKQTGSEAMRRYYMRYFSDKPCPTCNGERLKPESRAVRIRGKGIVDLSRLTIVEAHRWLGELALEGSEARIADELLKEISNRLKFLLDVGLSYLTLDRPGPSLSGGESQRIRLASQMGAELTGVIYILDEPSIGLHQRDNGKLLATLKRLRDIGNSVIVVEHDEETMEAADHLIDLGPGAGKHGGLVIAEGTVEQVRNHEESITGRYLRGEIEIPIPEVRRRMDPTRVIRIEGAREHNLRNLDVEIPLGLFVAVTGVSGSGKSTLIEDILHRSMARHFYRARVIPGAHTRITGFQHLDKVIDIDQSPIGRTPRSNPATYTGLFTPIRELFAELPEAKIRGYGPGRFSFNVKGGRCEACEGDGLVKIEMHFLPDVYVPCDVCKGKRYNRETLEVRFRGLSIADVLEQTVEDALYFFENQPRVRQKLQTLFDVGLGYIHLGQSATTLSGGEAQRVKLAAELSKRDTGRTFYILDEPTTGLHFEDVRMLMSVLHRLVDRGNTVLVIEHNLDVIKTADWIVDLGPEGGLRGGDVVAAGTPEDVAAVKESYTGQYLRTLLNRKSNEARRPITLKERPAAISRERSAGRGW
ncbi:MAG: excinuclease ABC subunit UvrA, partial [Gemmatimonadaceae bacterium]